MVHCYLWSIFKLRMKYGFLLLQIDNYKKLPTLNSDKNWVSWTVHLPTMCLAASQTQDPQSTKAGIKAKGSVREQGASSLTQVHFVQTHS